MAFWPIYVAIIICVSGFLPLALETYRNRKLPFMKAVKVFDRALKRKGRNLPPDLSPLFFCRESHYDMRIKQITLLLLEAAQKKKIILAGSSGVLLGEQIDPIHVVSERIRFVKGLPVLYDVLWKEIYRDLHVNNSSFFRWIKTELASVSYSTTNS